MCVLFFFLQCLQVYVVENVWKQSRETGVLSSGSGSLNERCGGVKGVLIGGKWHDARSQQRIIYLTHVEKAYFGNPEGSLPCTEAKLSHLDV